MNVCTTHDAYRNEWAKAPRARPKTLVICAILWVGVYCCPVAALVDLAQAQNGPPAANSRRPILPGQDNASIGQSGFRVRIPEIKMNRIIGGGKAPIPATGSQPPDGKSQPQSESPEAAPSSERDRRGPPETSSSSPSPGGERTSIQTPAPALESVVKSRETPSRQPLGGPAVRAQQQRRAGPTRNVQEHHDRAPRAGAQETPSARTEEPASPHRDVQPRTEETEGAQQSIEMLMQAPKAPEDAVQPPPPPRKEILRLKSSPDLPLILKNTLSKEGAAPLSIPQSEADDLADQREWIQLEQRREPEIVPPAELEPLPEDATQDLGSTELMREPEQTPRHKESLPKRQPSRSTHAGDTEPQLKRDHEPEAAEEHTPVLRPPIRPEMGASRPEAKESLAPEAPPEPKTEHLAPEAPLEPDVEHLPPKETVPSAEETPSEPKEVLPSPLNDEALHSREVKEYLQQTAPILEELSMLMTTAPSLNLADYDPSDPSAPAIPRDIYLRMDAMKRQLQILDSKTFAIIPPKKYTGFHSLIRESIAETNQACTAIMSYLQKSNLEDLRVIQDHLLRAKRLIQRTREQSDKG